MKTSLRLYSLLLMCIICISCKEQKKTDSKKSNTSHKIKDIDITNSPKSITRTIKQDKNGNIWFATWKGIIKYDGNSFTNITSNVSLSRFFSILEDKKGNFWFASVGEGVYYYDGKSFINFTTKDGLINNRVTNIYEDKKGNIWFGTEGGVSCYDGISFKNFTTKEGLTSNDINTIIEDNTGKFWIGTRGNACFYDGNVFTEITNEKGLPFENVRHIIKDKKGSVWLGGKDGLWNFSNNTFKNFSQEFTGYIYEDKKGNILTTSESSNTQGWALSRYDVASLTNKKPILSRIMGKQGMLFGILEDIEGGIWVGTLNGIYHYNGNTFNDFKNGFENNIFLK